MLIYDMKIFLLVLSSFLISGCTSKENRVLLDDFSSKSQELSQTIQTQKVTVLNKNGEVSGFVTALYLYNKSGRITTNKGENEKFIVGIYNDDRSDNIPTPIITLFWVKPISIRKVEHSETILSQIPLKNRWSRYYEVTFPPYKISTDMELEVKAYALGTVVLKFSKSLNFIKE
jgi:hypothetical protein